MSSGKKKSPPRKSGNRKRSRKSAYEGLASMNRRAHQRAENQLGPNRRLRRKGEKSIWASVAYDEYDVDEDASAGFFRQLFRWMLALVLLPVCWVTTWTFLRMFSHATLEQGFWQSSQFWYFTIGAVVMCGWFFSKLAQPFFLYLYVFGHEFTHAVFVKAYGGKVFEIKWGADGGYVTTDKSNWVISLSPYFVPFWSVITVVLYVVASFFWKIPEAGELGFYAAIGATWAFHLTWTLWMIPRDQPDLNDNGTLLSLVLIYFGNLLVLIGLLCFATPNPLMSLRDFGFSWFGTAMTWGDTAWRWIDRVIERLPQYL